jgi:hypothetical protein
MKVFTHVVDVEPIHPTSIGFRLADSGRSSLSAPIVVSPVNFLADFALFLTAIRAAGTTDPIAADRLLGSWEKACEALRRRLIEEDPWGDRPAASPGQEAVVALGEERLEQLRAKRKSTP